MDTLTPLEQAVLEKLLSGESDRNRFLYNQIPALRVIERKMTGVGFFTSFSIAEEIPKLADKATFQIGGVGANINDLEHGAGFVLFVEDGQIETLEGYTYDEPWPRNADSFQLHFIPTSKKGMTLEGTNFTHIHLAHENLPPCDEDWALRLFVAHELIEAGVTPETLLQAQGFDPTPLAKDPDQPRVSASSGRDSGESTSGGAYIIPPAFRNRRGKGRHGRGGGFDDRFLRIIWRTAQRACSGRAGSLPKQAHCLI